MTDTLLIWKTFEEKGFFATMRQKLRDREPKQTQYPTVESIPVELLLPHLISEVEELGQALKKNDAENIREECCDLANLLGMIFVNAKDGVEQK